MAQVHNFTKRPVNVHQSGDPTGTFNLALTPCERVIKATRVERRDLGTINVDGSEIALTDTPTFDPPTDLPSVGDHLPNGRVIRAGDFILVGILDAVTMAPLPDLTVVVAGPAVKYRGRVVGCTGLAEPPAPPATPSKKTVGDPTAVFRRGGQFERQFERQIVHLATTVLDKVVSV